MASDTMWSISSVSVTLLHAWQVHMSRVLIRWFRACSQRPVRRLGAFGDFCHGCLDGCSGLTRASSRAGLAIGLILVLFDHSLDLRCVNAHDGRALDQPGSDLG